MSSFHWLILELFYTFIDGLNYLKMITETADRNPDSSLLLWISLTRISTFPEWYVKFHWLFFIFIDGLNYLQEKANMHADFNSRAVLFCFGIFTTNKSFTLGSKKRYIEFISILSMILRFGWNSNIYEILCDIQQSTISALHHLTVYFPRVRSILSSDFWIIMIHQVTN